MLTVKRLCSTTTIPPRMRSQQSRPQSEAFVFRLSCQTKTLQKKPRGFLGDPQNPVNFHARNAAVAVGQHPNCGKPLVQRNRRIFEDGFCTRAELLAANPAFENPARGHVTTNRSPLTIGTFNALRPAQVRQIPNTEVRILKELECFVEGRRKVPGRARDGSSRCVICISHDHVS